MTEVNSKPIYTEDTAKEEAQEVHKDQQTRVPQRALNTQEVADILGVTTYTVHELLRDGRLPGFKIKSQWRIRPHELENFMQAKQAK